MSWVGRELLTRLGDSIDLHFKCGLRGRKYLSTLQSDNAASYFINTYIFKAATTCNCLFFAFEMRRNLDLLFVSFSMTRKYLTTYTRGLILGDRKVAGFVSLFMLFNPHTGTIYRRSKSYLFVKVSSDIVTEDCSQVRSTCRLCADMVSESRNQRRNLWVWPMCFLQMTMVLVQKPISCWNTYFIL